MFDPTPDEPVTVDGLTVTIMANDFGANWDLMGDEPARIFAREKWDRFRTVHDESKHLPSDNVLYMIAQEDWEEIVAEFAFDYEERKTGIVVSFQYERSATFKNWRNAAKGILKREGYDLDGIHVEEIRHQYDRSSDSYFVAWSQKALDTYAGKKNAEMFLDDFVSILSGDVWYISVLDENEEVVDSCGGFIGEYWSKYIQDEAKRMLEDCIAYRREAA